MDEQTAQQILDEAKTTKFYDKYFADKLDKEEVIVVIKDEIRVGMSTMAIDVKKFVEIER